FCRARQTEMIHTADTRQRIVQACRHPRPQQSGDRQTGIIADEIFAPDDIDPVMPSPGCHTSLPATASMRFFNLSTVKGLSWKLLSPNKGAMRARLSRFFLSSDFIIAPGRLV
ncbi:MAG: hypothetical protein KDK75_13035, partial [Alphaproteobacteria bacterium]|nr:hypothetical protein [Alphaproteobacteria bacterium]